MRRPRLWSKLLRAARRVDDIEAIASGERPCDLET
jgi:hypothetical protein